ncbi:cytochrome b/b6 domain-containing protein [Pyrobaculum neutrophilum]|uniref:Formate dehydrogenase, cytochrome b556 subunit (Formate dehydrogenase gamma subunit) n=1 Tax=Pyrobaculum neutrophilum (strain DSM 2338 / JCM 9278 / NBRC 100436 / V24Sta) TaxID=444157 RepID=B1YBS1_PYRNV|nr:cytochrome b/b6 domain-containing protein [Pyrobaculum neutrophilum]ACB39305.1 formate dehydrogenase, cytochrome b556 subunit (formate dehydrogenase gamma subunit) [Pyrobaculum neutrophilum V24Sta]ACB39985.1 formate dehydrogenase, cytochrome b556 subunit (formate dehydrogenase gamma subunit) [Pyrobaculum neutrophilum V24Sta]
MDKVEVVSIGYRIAHHWNLLLFTVLAITGGALFAIEVLAPLVYAVGAPLAAAVGTDAVTAGAQLLRTSHRFLGHIWGALLLVYAVNLLFFRKVRIFDALRKPLGRQIREAKALAGHYLLGRPLPEDVKASMERHNVFVAYMALLLIASVVLLSISGVALVYRDALGLSVEEARLMLLLHDVGFALGLLFVALHVFAVLHPANRPLLNAMFGDGTIPLDWAKTHMPNYLRRRGAAV